MRMYELWKLGIREGDEMRLEDGGGPVLFLRVCDAQEYSRADVDSHKAAFAIVPVRVGLA